MRAFRRGVRGLIPVLALCACAPDDEPPVAAEILGDDVEMAMLDMDHYLTREGVRRARLRADTAEFLADGTVRMRPIELTFFDRQGNELSVVTGDSGTYDETTEDMEARGSVVAIDHRDGQRLETNHLRYQAEEDRLYGEEPFTLYRDDGRTVLRGSGFETDPGLASILMFDSSGRTEQAPPARPPTPSAVQPDSAPDSTAAPPDSSTAPPDSSTVATPDSTATPPDSSTAPPDTTSTVRTGPRGARP